MVYFIPRFRNAILSQDSEVLDISFSFLYTEQRHIVKLLYGISIFFIKLCDRASVEYMIFSEFSKNHIVLGGERYKGGKNPMITGVKQHDIRDCGAACLATVLLHYKSYIPLSEIREKLKVGRNGSSMYAISQVAGQYGLDAEAYNASLSEVLSDLERGELSCPIILHTVSETGQGHFVVLMHIETQNALVFDPAVGKKKYKYRELEGLFSGYFLAIRKNADFSRRHKTIKPYKKFIDMAMNYKCDFFKAILYSLLIMLVSIIISMSYQRFVDYYIIHAGAKINLLRLIFPEHFLSLVQSILSKKGIALFFGAIIFLYFIQSFLVLMRGHILLNISTNVSSSIRKKYIAKLLHIPTSFFHDRETGEIISRYYDIEEIQDIISVTSITSIMNFITASASAILLFKINATLFLFTCCMLTGYLIVVLFFLTPLRNVSQDIMEFDAKLSSRIKELVNNIISIKASQGESWQKNELHALTDRLIAKERYSGRLFLIQNILLDLLQEIGALIVLWKGYNLIIDGTISLGVLITYESLMYFFLEPVQSLISLQIDIQQALVSATRLNDVLDVSEEQLSSSQDKTMQPNHNNKICLSVKDLRYSYDYDNEILHQVDFSVMAGETVALIGDNGSGKSTLLKVCARIIEKTDGQLIFNGTDSVETSLREWRQRVVYVPQNSELFSATIRDNITYGREYSSAALACAIRDSGLSFFLKKRHLDLDYYVEENGCNLSSGEQQKISIARALLCAPDILLLDESICNMDFDSKLFVFSQIQKKTSLTSIWVTHENVIVNMCDKVVDLNKYASNSP